jgi:hypothetical protein
LVLLSRAEIAADSKLKMYEKRSQGHRDQRAVPGRPARGLMVAAAADSALTMF